MPRPFISRHIGPTENCSKKMLALLGESSLEDFVHKVVPKHLQQKNKLELVNFAKYGTTEEEIVQSLRKIASENRCNRSYIGTGYYGTVTPAVIQRNILENPGWYTQYTPYQAEISQGRLEALFNFQTLISELSGLPVANASLLDEATACAEAMALSVAAWRQKGDKSSAGPLFVIDANSHPQNIAVLETRARALGVRCKVSEISNAFVVPEACCGILLQYPGTNGELKDFADLAKGIKNAGALLCVAACPLALVLLESPGSWGADVVLGSMQRFGVPVGFGGPHAAYFAVRDEYKRLAPGRFIGMSKDKLGSSALRLALQTREQHIRREKATSNICTAQVLLAVMASMYAVYHGPKGLKEIAEGVHAKCVRLAKTLQAAGLILESGNFFDSLNIKCDDELRQKILARAVEQAINLRTDRAGVIGVSIDESVSQSDLADIAWCFTGSSQLITNGVESQLPKQQLRKKPILTQEVFNRYHSETELLRYMRRLESKDLSLATAMIPLGSCTMKLNATSEMLPVTWPEFATLHPFAPLDQSRGYQKLFGDLESALCEITGFDAVSLQPNAGSQGEFAGLLAIRGYFESLGQSNRNVCLIPISAHGTNPATATMAGFKVVVVACDDQGNISLDDLANKANAHRENLGLLMLTYPSTHGVFEERVKDATKLMHDLDAQVYLDGANLNALVGLCRPADLGADVCHINLHKTFCIPHGGGGPGMGPIGVRAHLAPFLPGHPVVNLSGREMSRTISAAPWGSASILPISWVYMALMGAEGLTAATRYAILNANYIAKRLSDHYPVLYRSQAGYVAHECIIDLRPLKAFGVEAEDVAKRLMDYGFHAPTVSFPVVGTLMIEPTESESLYELDRFCEAMIAIRNEVREIEAGRFDKLDNPLKNAPHTALEVCADKWTHPYSRVVAAFPSPAAKEFKFWPSVARVDGVHGDKNFICSCAPLEDYQA